MNTYEGMFILDPATATPHWETAKGEIERILKKHGATLINMDPWGERKLTYRIRKHDRGVYALSYFQAPAEAITGIREDSQLSEIIIRSLILRHEGEIKKVEAPKEYEKREYQPRGDQMGRGEPYNRMTPTTQRY